MYDKYTLFVNPLKTGDITHMRRQCVPALPLGGRGLGTRLTSNLKRHDLPLDTALTYRLVSKLYNGRTPTSSENWRLFARVRV